MVALGIGLALAGLVASSGGAAATMGAPSWSTGDSWTWTWSSAGVTFVKTWTVQERTSVVIGTHTYDAWHVNETTVRTTTSGSSTTWNGLWLRQSDLGMVKEVLGDGAQTYLWDPPLTQAVFPLGGNSWSSSTTQTHITPLQTVSTTVQFSGTALAETNVSVPRGAFNVVPVRTPSSGSIYQVMYYSEVAGNWVEIQSYAFGILTTTQVLTDFRYQSPGFALFLWLLGGFVALGLAAVAVLTILRRRHRRWPRYPPPPEMQGPKAPPPTPPPGGPPGM